MMQQWASTILLPTPQPSPETDPIAKQKDININELFAFEL